MKNQTALLVFLSSIVSGVGATPQSSVQEDYVWQERFNERMYAAQSGNAQAQFNIGEMFERGSGVALDLERAFVWFERAALQNHQKARFKLAYMYYRGEGTTENPAKAFQLMEKLANSGYSRAQYYLGLMYETGVVTTQSAVHARAWYQRAAEGGYTPADEALAGLAARATKFTPAEEGFGAGAADRMHSSSAAAVRPALAKPDIAVTVLPQFYTPWMDVTIHPPYSGLQGEAARGASIDPIFKRGLPAESLSSADPLVTTIASLQPAIQILPTPFSQLVNGNWRTLSDRPVEFLPSTMTTCEQGAAAELECLSKEIVSIVENAEVAYQTRATIWAMQPSGEFKVKYRNNVVKILRNLDPENPADRPHTGREIRLGWQGTEHHLECRVESGQTVQCLKNKTTKLTIKNQIAM